jgi:hypothetical protein
MIQAPGFKKHTIFLHYGINYGRKKLYDTDSQTRVAIWRQKLATDIF